MVNGISPYSNQDIWRQMALKDAQKWAQQGALQGQVTQNVQTPQEEIVVMPQQQTQAQQPQAQAPGCTDGKDDGKIGFWQSVKHFGKGILNFGKSLIGFDENGKWSAGKLLKNVAIGAGIAAVCVLTAGTAVPAIIAGVGVASAAGGLGKSIYQFATAKTDAQARAAAEGMGSNTVALAGSVVGAKAAMKGVPGVDASKYTGFKGTVKAAWDSTTIGFKQGWNGIKTGYQAYKAGGWQALKTTAVDGAKSFKATVQTNWKNATKTPTVEEAQAQKVKKYDTEIEQLKAQADDAAKNGNKGVANSLKKKAQRLEEQKANIERAFNEINSEKSLVNAQAKLDNLEKQIALKKKQVETSTNTRQNFIRNHEISQLEQQANIYKNVINQKTQMARNIRSQIDDIDNLPPEAKTADIMTKRAELVKKQKELDFEIPARSLKETYAKNASESTKTLLEKQEAYTKAKEDLAAAEKANKKFEPGDPSDEAMLAQRKLYEAKAAASNAYDELAAAKIANKSNSTLSSATGGYDYTGTFSDKVFQFGRTFNNLYGSAKVPVIGGKKVPFTRFTIPAKVSNTQAMLVSNPYVNSSVGGPSIEEMMLAQMGCTPEQMEQLKALDAAVKAGQMTEEQAMMVLQQVAGGSAPQTAAPQTTQTAAAGQGQIPPYMQMQALDSMLQMYGIA